MSCGEKNKNTTSEKNQYDLEEKIIVELALTVLENDQFELYYKTRKEENYTSEKRVTYEVVGSKKKQTLQFVLDQGIYPYSIRLDFGRNQKQGEILVHELIMRYNQGTHVFDSQEIQKYFVPNKYVNFDFDTMTARTIVVDGKYDPYLASHNISKFVNRLILY